MRFEYLDAAFAIIMHLKISTAAIFKTYLNFGFISFLRIDTALLIFSTNGSDIGMCRKPAIN